MRRRIAERHREETDIAESMQLPGDSFPAIQEREKMIVCTLGCRLFNSVSNSRSS